MQYLIYALIIDFFFGLNGRQILIGNEPIRSVLYYSAVLAVCIKGLYHLFLRIKIHKQNGLSFGHSLLTELRIFRMTDVLFGILVVMHGIWIFLIPYTQRSEIPNAIGLAYDRAHPILYTAIYFPAVYLIRIGKVAWKKYRNFVIGCCVTIAFIHIILYVGETIQRAVDSSVFLFNRIQRWWNRLIGGHSDLVIAFMPYYSVRIIQNFNLFIPMSFYFIIGRKEKRYLLWSILNILALFTVSARSHIVAIIAGICVYCFLDWMLQHYTKEQWKSLIKKAILVMAFAILTDVTLFDGRNITRLASSFLVSESVLESGERTSVQYASRDYSTESEILGTRNSNSSRILEIKYSIEKFLEKPILGHSYTLKSIDMQAIVYLARTGLVGLFLWVICIGYLFRHVYRLEKEKQIRALPVCYFFTTILVDSVFQYTFSPVVIAGIVFVMLDLAYRSSPCIPNQEEEIQPFPLSANRT